MSALTDILRRAAESVRQADGTVSLANAAAAALPLVKDDAEAVDIALREAVSINIKRMLTREAKTLGFGVHGQIGDLFGVRAAHVLDLEERIVKETDSMSRVEFDRLRSIRRKQLNDDAAYLDILDRATSQLALFWDAEPELTYGEVKVRYLAARKAAA